MDNLTPQNPANSPMPGGSAIEGEPKQGFMSTTRGKAIVIGGAVVGFLVVAGIVAFLVMTFVFGGSGSSTGGAKQTASKPGKSTGGSAEASSVIEPAEIGLNDIFTFRDIFDPLLKPAPAQESTSTETSSTLVPGEADTLYLNAIVVEDGVTKAVLQYNDTEYRLAAGETVGTTPWQVLSIGSSSVVMLYGDSQVSLSVGQGLTDTSAQVDNK